MEKPKSLTELQTTMDKIITVKKFQILEKKPVDAQYLNYGDYSDICATIKGSWCQMMDEDDAPKAIQSVCHMTLAIVAPDKTEREKQISQAKAAVSGIAGISAIIGAIGMALGWGTGIIGAITAFFCGAPILGPLGLLAGGALLAAIAAYFAIESKNKAKMSEMAEKVLRDGLNKALEGLWAMREAENK